MTPHELNLYLEVYHEKERAAEKERAILVYMGAKMPLMKQFPTFEKAFGYAPEKKQPKKQTPEDMFKMALELNKAMGGTVY